MNQRRRDSARPFTDCCIHLYGSFFSCRGDPLAVGAEFEAVDPLAVAFIGEDATLSPAVPQFEVGVGRAGGQEVAVGVEVDAGDAGLVTGQGADEAGGLEVPDLEGARLGSGANQLLGVAEADAFHGGRVAAQTLQGKKKIIILFWKTIKMF